MFLNVFTQVVILFILIFLGAILTKKGVFTEKGISSMTDMVLLLVTPCVIIKSFIREFDSTTFKKLLISLLIAILSHISFIILSRVLLRDKKERSQKVLQFGVIFSNCGYMSIPLQQALLGDDGIFYGASYIAIFQIFIWSYGLLLMSGDKKVLSPKKMLINPGVIGVSIGLIIFLLSIPVPKVIAEPISYIASLNTPLPMLIIGYHLMKSNILEGLRNIKCFFAIGIKLFLFPLLALLVMYLCGVRGTMLISSVISCSAPTAAITTMFSNKYSCDTALSVNMVSISTLLSLISMPILITLAQHLA
jgi:predicted permease